MIVVVVVVVFFFCQRIFKDLNSLKADIKRLAAPVVLQRAPNADHVSPICSTFISFYTISREQISTSQPFVLLENMREKSQRRHFLWEVEVE